MKKLLIIAAMGAFVFNSCKKEETTAKTKTKTELLTSAKWIGKSFTINPGIDIGGGVVITDFYTQLEPCDKDDYDKFEINGLGTSNEGALKCDPTSPQSTAFTWALKNNETVLTQDGEDGDLVTLNETDLIVSYIFDGADLGGTPGIKYKATLGYKH